MMQDWATERDYDVGDRVACLGEKFTCISAHRSNVFSKDLFDLGLWMRHRVVVVPRVVRRVAKLSRLDAPDGEGMTRLRGELQAVFDMVSVLDEVDTEGVEPMLSVSHDLPMRDDVVTDGGRREEILSNAPDHERGFFTVPKVVME